jgi:response regulator RpfG family c-di-GMP phosphodiesterase
VVLLVDDEERILSALRRCLRREGYRLLTAETPERALALLAAEPVDLIVSDHKMPGMSGLALLARAAALRPGAARLMLTGWPEALRPADLERAGVARLLTKPWDDADLKSALRSALGDAPGGPR